MKRKKFIGTFGCALIGLPIAFGVLQSCGGFYYAKVYEKAGEIRVAKSEFIVNPKNPDEKRDYVLINSFLYQIPICLYRIDEGNYIASLLKCTHKGCQLDVAGDIYRCPCHGSQFSKKGNVLRGPADQKLKTFKTTSNEKNIIISLS